MGPTRPLLVVVSLVVGGLWTGSAPSAARPPARVGPEVPVPISGPDPALTDALEAVVALSLPDTCLRVDVDGTEVFDHRGDDPQIPASTLKVLTAGAVLDAMGADHRYETTLVAGGPVVDGVVRGDVVMVGSGDPVLVSSLYRALRQFPEDRPVTLLDGLAAQLVEQGITAIEGRVVGDESRYDDQRVVASWPDRYATDNEAGPLSALTVDGAFALDAVEGGFARRRSASPPADAARVLTALLEAAGISVAGEPAAGTAGDDAALLASVASPPVGDLVAHLLQRSDNQMAELFTKELAARNGQLGTTEAGARELAAWAAGRDVTGPGSFLVDGSGLDRGNRLSCDELVATLRATGGPGGTVDDGLPVAGESGTLRGRFTTTDAVGVLRAKTGSLNSVSSLAGHVRLPDGGTATFAYVVNGDPIDADTSRTLDLLAQVLATYLPPCPLERAADIVAPAVARAAVAGALDGFAAAALVPGLVGSMHAVEQRGPDLIDRCAAARDTQVGFGFG